MTMKRYVKLLLDGRRVEFRAESGNMVFTITARRQLTRCVNKFRKPIIKSDNGRME